MAELNLWTRTELEIFKLSDSKQTGILSLLWTALWGSLSEVNIPLDILFQCSFAQCLVLAAWKVKLRGGKDSVSRAEEPNLKH